MNRRLALEGVENFRDFGGYATASGQRLRAGRLYRSASHGRATDEDLAVISRLGIRLVVDLRRPQERERDPSRRPADFSADVISNDMGAGEEDSWLAHVASSDLTARSFHEYMYRYYAEAPFNPRILDLYSRYFAALAQAEGPVLIHCAAGKDRTGILAALTHHLAGVHSDDLMADYLATNDPERIERRLPILAKTIEEVTGRKPGEAALKVAMGVEAGYLETALSAIAERYGDVDRYIDTGLGVDASRREKVMERLLD